MAYSFILWADQDVTEVLLQSPNPCLVLYQSDQSSQAESSALPLKAAVWRVSMSIPSGSSLANLTGIQESSPGLSASAWSIVAKRWREMWVCSAAVVQMGEEILGRLGLSQLWYVGSSRSRASSGNDLYQLGLAERISWIPGEIRLRNLCVRP